MKAVQLDDRDDKRSNYLKNALRLYADVPTAALFTASSV